MNIIPLVKWLNSFNSVHTLHSCEGKTKKEQEGDQTLDCFPYVLFTCWDQLELMILLRDLDAGTCEATYYEPYGLRYFLKFPDKETLLAVCERNKYIKKFA